jgi:hypothetical protein
VPNPVADKLQVAVVGETCHSRVVACPEVTDDAAEVSVTVGAVTPVETGDEVIANTPLEAVEFTLWIPSR